jgi:NADH-quinone oxidoreductase subunit F
MSKNLSELSGRKGLRNNLFEKLGKAADGQGTPSVEAMDRLCDEFLVGKANVYGTVSFYDFLKPENRGKKVYVCNGSACLTAGTQDALRGELETRFGASEVGEMCCLGRCHENAAFHLDGINYSGAAVEQIDAVRAGAYVGRDRYQVGHLGTSVLTAPFPGIENHYRILIAALERGPDALLQELKISGLRGRGGAGFSMAFKLDSCRQAEGPVKFIVCNADEGDPGAYSDRYIMEQQPHCLLLGMMLAGFIAGAETGVLYIRAEYPESVAAMQQAVEELYERGLLGRNILGSGFSYDFKLIKAQGAYICGEETALLNSIEGQRPEVRVRPPYPTQYGLFNRPTVVNNVETLANLPWIFEHGGAAFAALGRGESTGTKLLSLDSHFNRPGIYEVDMGTPLAAALYGLGGGFRHPVKALHIGGPLGGLVPIWRVEDLTVDFESFAENGFLLGHASVVCLPAGFPVIQYLEHLFEFTAHESCGKCFPCRLGSTRGFEMLRYARTGAGLLQKTLVADLLDTMEIGSLCALGGGLPLPVRNALQYFEEELAPYFQP